MLFGFMFWSPYAGILDYCESFFLSIISIIQFNSIIWMISQSDIALKMHDTDSLNTLLKGNKKYLSSDWEDVNLPVDVLN